MSNLSQNIRKYREQMSMSQEELAQKLYVTRQTISNYENGKTEPDLDRIEEMALFVRLTGESKRREIGNKKRDEAISLLYPKNN